MKRVLILFHRQWHIRAHFQEDSHQQAFLCHINTRPMHSNTPQWKGGERKRLKSSRRGGIMNPLVEARTQRKNEKSKTKGKSCLYAVPNFKTHSWICEEAVLAAGTVFIMYILATQTGNAVKIPLGSQGRETYPSQVTGYQNIGSNSSMSDNTTENRKLNCPELSSRRTLTWAQLLHRHTDGSAIHMRTSSKNK